MRRISFVQLARPAVHLLVRCTGGILLAGVVVLAKSNTLQGAEAGKPETLMPVEKKPDSEADSAWKELEALQPPSEPKEWATHEPSEEERREFQKQQVEFACRYADQARNFYTRFPTHDMASFAMNLEKDQIVGQFKIEVMEYRLAGYEREATKNASGDESVVLAEMEKGIRALLKVCPEHFVPNQALLRLARQLGGAKGLELAQQVRDTKGTPDFVKEEAVELLKKLEATGKPLALKFTALGGQEVDLQKLRGKVVLIDFWATWCVPCVAELPHIKAIYNKLHPDGFEIVGISLDEKKEALTKFVEKEAIPWPQFFDGKGWQNQFAQEWAVKSIPSLWLVDRKGVLRDINARGTLEEKVRKLLAEKF